MSRGVVLCLVAAALLRLLLIAWVQATGPDRALAPDSPSYESPALALLEIHRFAVAPDRPDVPESIRTPGYPLFIAATYAVTGPRRVAVLLAQVGLSVGAIAWTAHLARRWFGPRGAVASAALLAVEPVGWAHTSLMLSETLFTLAVVAVLAAAAAFARSPGRRPAILLGLACACAAWVRPIAYFLPLIVVPWVLIRTRGRPASARSRGIAAAAVLLPWIVLVGGWQVRNYVTTGSAEFSHVAGRSLYKWRAAGVVAVQEGIAFEAAQARLVGELPDLDRAPAAEANRGYRNAALAIFKRYPAATLRVAVKGLAQLTLVPGESYLLQLYGARLPERGGPLGDLLRLDRRSYLQRWLSTYRVAFLVFVFALAHLAILYFGVARAVWRNQARRNRGTAQPAAGGLAWLLLLMVVYFALLSSGPESEPRLRLPITPILALYAGVGWSTAPRHGGGPDPRI